MDFNIDLHDFLAGNNFYKFEVDGILRPYCEQHYYKINPTFCEGCKNIIKGEVFSAMDCFWHKECFVCEGCKKPFKTEGNESKSKFYVKDTKPYCHTCFNDKFVKKCHICNLIIESEYIVAMGKNYHKECFTCMLCKTNLSGKEIMKLGENPVCKLCYCNSESGLINKAPSVENALSHNNNSIIKKETTDDSVRTNTLGENSDKAEKPCNGCGYTKNTPEYNFCGNCGFKLKK